MAKVARGYFQVDPYLVIEEGFDKNLSTVSESVFSLGNEYMGVRGFFDESYSGKTLIGSYFNGIYEYSKEVTSSHYKGVAQRTHYMVNALNYFYTRIFLDNQELDLNRVSFSDFKRVLDLRSGELTREFIWNLGEKKLLIKFHRIVKMKDFTKAFQKIEFQALNFSGEIKVDLGLDFRVLHWGKPNSFTIADYSLNDLYIVGSTSTKQLLLSKYNYNVTSLVSSKTEYHERLLGSHLVINLTQKETVVIEKKITNLILKEEGDLNSLIYKAKLEKNDFSYLQELRDNQEYFQEVFAKRDITISGDLKNQQGIRYCLFQLEQTYHGVDERNNIGAKGLTGEAYSGHAFWDTETYCFPFYLFNNPKAAKNLLMYRYHTLNFARKRAKELDCLGACYPIATLNGTESCSLWQHASLQMQPSTAVAYAIWHYVKNTHDFQFLQEFGLEMLLEIARYVYSRGDFNSDRSRFGFFGVMGPDEFQMMVNHNMYTNYMGKRTLDFLLKALNSFQSQKPQEYLLFMQKFQVTKTELENYQEAVSKMLFFYDSQTQLFEQHHGYYDLPHIDIHQIPISDFPLYNNWSYDRIYRNDMIKQPDVLMAMFLYNDSFSKEEKKANYEFYEPRCIHESSLSPSIHSVIAAEIDKLDEAVNFFSFATRMDLDDYNRNTSEGLHTTSIAAAWINIVYGFGGMRTDAQYLKFSPKIPQNWDSYSFKIFYKGILINVLIDHQKTSFILDNDLNEVVIINNHEVILKKGLNEFPNE